MICKNGLTLLEILIIIIILGILAAVIIPQFTEANTEARASALISDLRKVRAQVELYKFQHNGQFPAATGETSADFDLIIGCPLYFFKDGKRIKITDADYKNGVFTPLRVIPEGKKEMDYATFRNS